jgi:hypothetical protein
MLIKLMMILSSTGEDVKDLLLLNQVGKKSRFAEKTTL